jgi:hypothetical protein
MALFVLGAGATRGASFVSPTRNPCLPPLDGDFFSQMQRVSKPKHQELIQKVIEDVVQLFGVNFQVTLEMMFTTLEHTLRMLQTTGENRDFKQDDVEAKMERLKQAIAATFEDSLVLGDRRIPRRCQYHKKLVKGMKWGDEIISFNYDCLIDCTLRNNGNGKWNPRYGYGFKLGSRGSRLVGDAAWMPENNPATREQTVKLYKLHGSLHFDIQDTGIKFKQRPYTKQYGDLRFTIIPPESNKRYDEGVFQDLWYQAGQALHRARTLVIIGYSFPAADSHSNALFRISLKRDSLASLVIVNPDREARRRTRDALRWGISQQTKVLVFDTFGDFAAAPRTLWEPA